MRILFLLAYYYPETAASIYLFDNLIEELTKRGHTIDLIVPTPSRGVDGEVVKVYAERFEEFVYDGKLHIHRFPLSKEEDGTFKRFLRYYVSLPKYVSLSKRIKDVDVIFCESTPPILCLAAKKIKKRLKVPLVYNLQDIFPDSLELTGLSSRNSMIYKFGSWIEKKEYEAADKIITISQDFKKIILSKGVPEGKIEVVYNWVDEQAVVDVPRSENVLFERYGLDKNKFYITYCGNIGLSQNMELLVRVAKDLQSYEDIRFVIIGNGAFKEKLEQIIAEERLKNIILLPFQPYEEISHVFSLGDVSLVISKPGTGNGCVPSKTWSIMSASRPVLANFDDCELREIVEKGGSGIFTLAGDFAAFKNAILELYNDREKCREIGENGRQFIMQNLTRSIGTQKYIKVLEALGNKQQ